MATRIYVGSLPFSATDEQLFQLFIPYGEVTEAAVAVDRYTSQTKGFGFVQMPDDAAARQAIAGLDGSALGDRTIRVDVAKPRVDRSDGAPRRDAPRGRRW